MYSLIISSVIVPELTARYPLAQKCRPQNFFRRCGYGFPEYPRADPFQPLHDLTDILVGPIREENVYVVAGHFATYNLQLMFHHDLPDQVAHTNSHISRQHCLAVFRDPYQMHFQICGRVRAMPISSHATTGRPDSGAQTIPGTLDTGLGIDSPLGKGKGKVSYDQRQDRNDRRETSLSVFLPTSKMPGPHLKRREL